MGSNGSVGRSKNFPLLETSLSVQLHRLIGWKEVSYQTPFYGVTTCNTVFTGGLYGSIRTGQNLMGGSIIGDVSVSVLIVCLTSRNQTHLSFVFPWDVQGRNSYRPGESQNSYQQDFVSNSFDVLLNLQQIRLKVKKINCPQVSFLY